MSLQNLRFTGRGHVNALCLGVDLPVPVYLKALQIPQRRDILHLTESEVQLGQALQIPRRALCRQ